MVAPLLATCEGSHAVAEVTAAEQSGGSGHSECPESNVPAGQTQHDEECQQSCVSMLVCTSLSFVGVVALREVPDESSVTPVRAVLRLPNPPLTPESPPPKA